MMSRNDGRQLCWRCQGERYASAPVVTRGARGGEVTVRAGVSSQYRTALQFVNGTVTSPYYLNNIINPVIVSLHEPHKPNFVFLDDKEDENLNKLGRVIRYQAGALNRVACTFSRSESHRKPTGSAELHLETRSSISQNLNYLRAALQEEWDVLPQQTIRQLRTTNV
ncbi:hypothetical protein ILYODFUR_003459 [Ilyodon furcidens]|uniref:Uncharacterized protein n=1 Tax=Ilyodon furcidens TaxID=33524 RepID=A0ABV0TFP1_9TELE